MEDFDEGDRSRVIGIVAAKVVALVVGIGLLIGLGTFGLVKFLDLNPGGGTSPVGQSGAIDDTPLPTTALPGSPTATPTGTPSSGQPAAGKGLTLASSPAMVQPMQRVNLTGRYPGKDDLELQIQRKQNGVWTNFPATVTVHVGAFATYVETGRVGQNQFRVLDTQTNNASKPVTVTIQ